MDLKAIDDARTIPRGYDVLVYIQDDEIIAKDGMNGGEISSATHNATNDTALIQDIFTNYDSVFFKRHNNLPYLINAQITRYHNLDNRPFVWHSDGAMFYCDAFSSAVAQVFWFRIGHEVDQLYNPVYIDGIQLDVNGANQPVSAVNQFGGIRLDRTFGSSIRRSLIKNSPWTGVALYRFSEGAVETTPDYCAATVIENCEFDHCGFTVNAVAPDDPTSGGVFVSNWVYGANISACKAHNCHNGFVLEDVANGSTVDRCSAYNNTLSGVQIQSVYDNIVSGCALISNGEFGIKTTLDNRYTKIVHNNCILNGVGGIFFNGGYSTIVNNTLLRNGDYGLLIYGNRANVVGNQIINNGTDGGASYKVGMVIVATTGNCIFGENVIADDTYATDSGSQTNCIDDLGVGYNEFVGNRFEPVSGNAVFKNFVAGSKFINNWGFITENSGSSTGTGAQQTIAHGMAITPNVVVITPTAAGATEQSITAAADATNIYPTVTSGKTYNWFAKYL